EGRRLKRQPGGIRAGPGQRSNSHGRLDRRRGRPWPWARLTERRRELYALSNTGGAAGEIAGSAPDLTLGHSRQRRQISRGPRAAGVEEGLGYKCVIDLEGGVQSWQATANKTVN